MSTVSANQKFANTFSEVPANYWQMLQSQLIAPQRVASVQNICKNFQMIEIRKSDLQAVIAASEALLVSLKKLADGYAPLEDSQEVKEKLAKRECLTCGIIVPDGEFYTRGLHKACYNTTMRRIREGRWKDEDRVAEGKLSVGGKPGRPAAIDAAEVIAKSIAEEIDNKKPKKVADKKSGYRKDS